MRRRSAPELGSSGSGYANGSAKAKRKPTLGDLWCLVRQVCCYLDQDFLNHLAVHVGEPEVAALVLERQLRVIDSEALEDGGLQVVDVNGVFGDVIAIIIGLALADAGFDAAAREPHGEAARMV